jgi:hypothetical protein
VLIGQRHPHADSDSRAPSDSGSVCPGWLRPAIGLRKASIDGGPTSHSTSIVEHPPNYTRPHKDGELLTVIAAAVSISSKLSQHQADFPSGQSRLLLEHSRPTGVARDATSHTVSLGFTSGSPK